MIVKKFYILFPDFLQINIFLPSKIFLLEWFFEKHADLCVTFTIFFDVYFFTE